MDNFIKEINNDINAEAVVDFIKEQGLDSYKNVRENGFRKTFEKRFDTTPNYDDPATMFDFTYFIATILNYDTMMFINDLAMLRAKDNNVESICSVFSVTLDQLVDSLNSIADIASTSITLKNPQDRDEWDDYIHAQRDYISNTIDIAHITGNILSVLVGNDVDYVEKMDEILEDLQEFYIAIEKIEEISDNINKEGTENV